MTAASMLENRAPVRNRETGRRTDPLRSLPGVSGGATKHSSPASSQSPAGKAGALAQSAQLSPTAIRLRTQLPPFAPLLEELEIAGWSAQSPLAGAGFHDWMLLGGDRILVVVGHAVAEDAGSAGEAALAAQALWSAVRAHALHAADAGTILSLASQSLWAVPASASANIAVALVDGAGGRTSVAIAGDCLAWRVRAATCEKLAIRQPALGSTGECSYQSQAFQLALRERLILLADDPSQRLTKMEATLTARFSQLDAESHRRMAAADAVALVRQDYDTTAANEATVSASIAAIRRR